MRAEHLPLGWTQRWDRSPFDGERDIDVAFLGSHTDRRARHLAGYAPSLWRWRSHLILSDNGRPNHDDGPDFVAGDDKRDLLARTRVLLNLHSSDLPYLEGLRLVDAIHCGAVVVSEHSAYTAPFEPGRDFWSAAPGEPDARRAGAARGRGPAAAFAADALQRLRRELPLRPRPSGSRGGEEVDRTAPARCRAAGPRSSSRDPAPPILPARRHARPRRVRAAAHPQAQDARADRQPPRVARLELNWRGGRRPVPRWPRPPPPTAPPSRACR